MPGEESPPPAPQTAPAEMPGAEVHAEDQPAAPQTIGTYHGEHFDWPVTRILEEETRDGEKWVHAAYLGGDGRTNALEERDAWFPARQVETNLPPEPQGAPEDKLMSDVDWDSSREKPVPSHIAESHQPAPHESALYPTVEVHSQLPSPAEAAAAAESAAESQPDDSAAPAEIIRPPQEHSRETEAAPEPAAAESPSLKKARETLARSEAQQAEVQRKLERAKLSAIDAITNEDFQKAAKLADEAANRKAVLRKVQKRAEHQKQQLDTYEDMLKPDNILDLKNKFDSQLQKEKDRRRRLQDDEPLDSYIAMLKGHLLDEYLQTGQEDGKKRRVSKKLSDEILELMNADYSELEARLEPQPPAQAGNRPGPEFTPDIDALSPIPDEDKFFSPLQEIQVTNDGKSETGWKVVGYGRRPAGEIMVNVISPDGRDDKWIEQPQLMGMQPQPEDAQPAPGDGANPPEADGNPPEPPEDGGNPPAPPEDGTDPPEPPETAPAGSAADHQEDQEALSATEIDKLIADNRAKNLKELEALEKRRGRSFGLAGLRERFKAVSRFREYYHRIQQAETPKGYKDMLVLAVGKIAFIATLSTLPGMAGYTGYRINKRRKKPSPPSEEEPEVMPEGHYIRDEEEFAG